MNLTRLKMWFRRRPPHEELDAARTQVVTLEKAVADRDELLKDVTHALKTVKAMCGRLHAGIWYKDLINRTDDSTKQALAKIDEFNRK